MAPFLSSLSTLLTSLLLLLPSPLLAAKPAPIVFVIQSQEGEFHTSLAERRRGEVLQQWRSHVPPHVMEEPTVLLSSSLPSLHPWTIFPLIKEVAPLLTSSPTVEWVALLEENTAIDLLNLNLAVEKYRFRPSEESLFLGRGVRDQESSIIHHFARPGALAYPDTEAGVFLSRKLVLDLHTQLENLEEGEEEVRQLFPSDFNIDPAYEFARFLFREGRGVELKHVDEICAKKSSKVKCLSSYKQETACLKSSQGKEMRQVLDGTLVAVKTCSKFHKDRVEVVRRTWGARVPHIEYISDVEDLDIPTKVLPHTVNTESGHCNKTFAVIHHFLDQEDKDTLVIADDDTVLSVARLSSLLSCYRGEQGPRLIGQRYGYMAASGRGYSYVTGGGGMLLNRAAASLLASCSCPREDTPDDMHLGMCARRLGIPVLHSGRMFQARPPDYPSSLLAYKKPVSFHKHWEIDPVKVYKDYFEEADSKLDVAAKEEL